MSEKIKENYTIKSLCINNYFMKRSKKTKLLKGIPLIALLLLNTACSTVSYYSQAVAGHLKMMHARQDIDEILATDAIDEELRQKLELAIKIRAFASTELGLPDNDSYKSYVATGKDSVTWNVVAAGEFSVNATKWCFPVAGCVSYKGYFDKADALAFEAELREQGMDTTVNGATAYSTLGWFDDPLLDTMLKGHEVRLVGLIFHELAHQKLYIKGDSDFNEAYASFVEQEGVRAWLRASNGLYGVDDYTALLSRGEKFSALLMRAREQLIAGYADKSLSDLEKRKTKEAVFIQMREDYAVQKAEWDGYKGYDRWFSRDLNNARLVATSTYRRWVPAFEAIYRENAGDLNRFYTEVAKLTELEKSKRDELLTSYLPKSVIEVSEANND